MARPILESLALSFAKKGGGMQDYLNSVEKLRKDADECSLISDQATDPAKRELFDRLAAHLASLADQVELAMIDASKSPQRR